MYFGIYNSYAVRNLILNGKKTILIRCLSDSEYQDKSLTIQNIQDYSAILELNLEDKNFLDYKNRELLNNFIINNDFDEVITHCSLGLSRSPAIMICIAKILQSSEMEELVKENYKFYNRGIVNDFEKLTYKTKNIIEKNFILRDTYNKNENSKVLVKNNQIIIR